MSSNSKSEDVNPDLTTEAWLEYWLESYIKPVAKPSAYEHYADNCRKHVIPIIGKIPLSEITPSILQKFFNDRADHGNLRNGGPLSPKSVKNMRVILDVAFKHAIAEGQIPANPVPLTAIKHVRSKRVEALTDSEQEALENHLFESDNPYSRAEIAALFTGARRGEICALCWRNYDETNNEIHFETTVKRLKVTDINSSKNKTELVFCSVKSDSSDRTLALPPFMQEILDAQRDLYKAKFGYSPGEDNFIFFSKNGGVMDPDNLSHYHNKVFNKLGLKHKKFHALRHTFATRGIENGIDVSTMSGLLGHADVTTTTHFYIRPRDAAMQRAMLAIRPVSSPTKAHKSTPTNDYYCPSSTNKQF